MTVQRLLWDQSFSVGVVELDGQHQQIFKLFNEFLDAADIDAGSEVVTSALTKMTEYASGHLEREEALLQQYGYPDFAGHKAEHMRYRVETVKLCMRSMTGDPRVPQEIGSFLRDWWSNHVLKTDMAYKSFLNSKGVR